MKKLYLYRLNSLILLACTSMAVWSAPPKKYIPKRLDRLQQKWENGHL